MTAMRAHPGRTVVIAVATVLVLLVGYAGYQYLNLTRGITTSDALGPSTGSRSTTTTEGAPRPDTNILIMGLDSRVDENGAPLPQDIYDALHAGEATDGGLNANVLMLLHVPGDGSKASVISIARDDYVDFPGCPDKQCKGKIKQAYGLGYAAAEGPLANDASLTKQQREQKARDAGRSAQVKTVQQFLGVTIDHFVEVTMVAFYQLAQVVQPITVCVKEATQDSYSGANFVAGEQQINASQAVAFVRQRRDLYDRYDFTDLDRERRQQAFISSLATQLKQAGTLANPVKLSQIIDVTKQNTAIDSGLNLLDFAQDAQRMAGGNVTYYTLPVKSFGKDPQGEDINVVDVAEIQATVKQLLAPPAASPTTTTGSTPAPSSTTTPGKAPSTKSTTSNATPTPSVPTTVPGTATPAPTDLTAIGGGGIPCVK
jgi:LCP family protein required for cell wall assembly